MQSVPSPMKKLVDPVSYAAAIVVNNGADAAVSTPRGVGSNIDKAPHGMGRVCRRSAFSIMWASDLTVTTTPAAPH